MNPDELFAKGKEAANRGNFGYAITLLLDVATLFPDHLDSRLALRACEEQVFQGRGQGFAAKLSAVIKGIGPLITILLMGKNPRKQMAACERFLVNWPTNAYVLMKLAEALKRMGQIEAAIQTLEYLRKRQPQNVKGLERLSDYYEETGRPDKAAQCYDQICRYRPKDEVAARKFKNLQSTAHVQRTGLDHGADSMQNVRDKDQARKLLEEDRLFKDQSRIEQEISGIQTQLQENPRDAKLLTRLGDLYSEEEKYKLAIQCYEKADEVEPKPQLRMRIGDIRMRVLRREEERLKALVQQAPQDATARTNLENFRRQRAQFDVQEFERRAADYPTDLRIAERLGDAYLSRRGEGDLQRAMSQYQRAVGDPRIKARVKRKLGYCFAQNPATHGMALAQYQEAREGTISIDERKRIDYEIGLLCERMGRHADALTAYRHIYEVDAGFQDVSERVMRLSQQGSVG